MRPRPRNLLHDFYRQALLTPELLCLNCGNTAWNRGPVSCPTHRRQDCLLFVSDMVNRLATRPRSSRERELPAGDTHP